MRTHAPLKQLLLISVASAVIGGAVLSAPPAQANPGVFVGCEATGRTDLIGGTVYPLVSGTNSYDFNGALLTLTISQGGTLGFLSADVVSERGLDAVIANGYNELPPPVGNGKLQYYGETYNEATN